LGKGVIGRTKANSSPPFHLPRQRDRILATVVSPKLLRGSVQSCRSCSLMDAEQEVDMSLDEAAYGAGGDVHLTTAAAAKNDWRAGVELERSPQSHSNGPLWAAWQQRVAVCASAAASHRTPSAWARLAEAMRCPPWVIHVPQPRTTHQASRRSVGQTLPWAVVCRSGNFSWLARARAWTHASSSPQVAGTSSFTNSCESHHSDSIADENQAQAGSA
jgi:hypothetical protein